MDPTQTLILASTPRTGSNMLCSILRATGHAGHAEEALNPLMMMHPTDRAAGADFRLGVHWSWPVLIGTRAIGRGGFLPDRYGSESLIRAAAVRPYLARQQRLTSTPNGVYAIKLHWNNWELGTQRWGLTVDDLGPARTWVWLTRRDRLAQAISMSIALQTRRWNSNNTANGEAVYDPERIARSFESLSRGNASWATWFEQNDITPIRAPYEDVMADLSGHVTRILEAIGVEQATVPAPASESQSTPRNQEWAERFLLEHPEYAERRYDTST